MDNKENVQDFELDDILKEFGSMPEENSEELVKKLDLQRQRPGWN